MILVCGEALFDVFLGPEDDKGRMALDAVPGGSPFNVAIGLARLKRKTAFFGGLSSDLFGEKLAAILKREGVDAMRSPRTDAPTTIAFVELAKDRAASYAFRGEGAADRDIKASDMNGIADDAKAIIFGSYSTVVAPTGDALLALARREKMRRPIVYDPNVRLTVESDAQRWSARFREFSSTAAIVKASEDDVAALMPGANADAFARATRSFGAPVVVVTRGAQGAVAFGPFGKVERPASPGTIVDTVGAGDAVTAAMVGVLDEADMLTREKIAALTAEQAQAMLAFALRAAAINCARRGADPARREEIGGA